jgi:putative methionine-R-sulfoxide reductase with GAF domain
MRKSDLLDELRSEIGVMSDKMDGGIEELYHFVIECLYEKVPAYQFVGIYLTKPYMFECLSYAGANPYPYRVRFGEGLHSLAAARGGVVREKRGKRTEVFVPFYRGHHLIGELVVVGEPSDQIDEEDIAFFCELASLFESKSEECNS